MRKANEYAGCLSVDTLKARHVITDNQLISHDCEETYRLAVVGVYWL